MLLFATVSAAAARRSKLGVISAGQIASYAKKPLRLDEILKMRLQTAPEQFGENPKWAWSEGRFLSVGAAVISCRNERAPDGLVADAHLSDGFLHLLLIRDCPLPLYLWHLTQFTKKGSDPLNFKFVEHHKTPAFTFVSSHDESVWNLDGELFQACEVSVQAYRGLVNLFASEPEL